MVHKHWRAAMELVSTIATLAVLLYVGVAVYQARKQNTAMTDLMAQAVERDKLNPDAVAKILPAVLDKNLIVAISVSCPYCKRSRGLYTSLLASRRKSDAAQILFAFPKGTSDESIRAFWGSSDVPNAAIVKADFDGCGIGATPTVLLLNGKREILRRWVGALTPGQEKDVLGSL